MLDASTGALHISPECVLGPDTALDGFKQAKIANAAVILVDKPPYLSVAIKVAEPGADREWSLTLCFEHDRIAMIVMSDITGDTADKTWDEAAEKDRWARHDRWLATQLGTTRTFFWGTADSFYDQREQQASIVLHYGILTTKIKAIKPADL